MHLRSRETKNSPRAGTCDGPADVQRYNVPRDKPETEAQRTQRHTTLLKACNWRIEQNQRKSWVLLPPRNHIRLVPFVSWMLLGIGANVDQEIILVEANRAKSPNRAKSLNRAKSSKRANSLKRATCWIWLG